MKTIKTRKMPDLTTLEEKAKAATAKAEKAMKEYEQAKLASMAYQYEQMEQVCKDLNITFDDALKFLTETYSKQGTAPDNSKYDTDAVKDGKDDTDRKD